MERSASDTAAAAAIANLPLPPVNPLPLRRRATALRNFHTGMDELREAGGPVTRFRLGPPLLTPTIVLATSPEAIRDILTVRDAAVDKTSVVLTELRRVMGANLFNLPYRQWVARRRTIQPVFTPQRVCAFAAHMSQAAEDVAEGWSGGGDVDLDAEARRFTLDVLGSSVLGLGLGDRTVDITGPLHEVLNYVADRALRPIRAPHWLPTPARRRARAASATLHDLARDILGRCRADPAVDAPLVRALMAATDPDTGAALSDAEIADELIVFLFAGHDTTATTLAYALWQLGRHPEMQERAARETSALPVRALRSDDVSALTYTTQVLKESLRLCPPGPTGTRLATRDVAVGGYRVPAGTMLLFGRLTVQRDASLWEKPLTFDPDRFAPDRLGDIGRYQYLPFGGGPRSCVGDHFAMLEMTIALATILRSHRVESLRDDFPLAVPFTMVAAAPVPARVHPRSEGTPEKAA